MISIQDDRGYNQGFKPTRALKIRTQRRCGEIIHNFNKKGKALEIGCGTGLHAYLIAKAKRNIKVVSSDICKPFIKKAFQTFHLANLKYRVLDFSNDREIEDLVKAEGKFDYIYGDGILHHLFYHLDDRIKQLKKILKPGGKIIFWEPNILNPYCLLIFKTKYFRKMAKLEPSECAFSVKHITNILEKNGFSKIDVSFKDFLLPNIPDKMVPAVIKIGSILEKIPLANRWSQSIFIKAEIE